MGTGTLAEALEREHHEIDAGIEEFVTGQTAGRPDLAPLNRATAALRRHIYLEEELVFPPLRASGLFAAIMVMLREHGEIWTVMDALEAEVAADPTSAAVRERCAELLALLESHNAKEEPIIYPQTDATLSPEAAATLREFLASGQMPDGWVCAKAAS